MKITLKDLGEPSIELKLSDEMLDNKNFVDIILRGNEITVDIEELFSAVLSFHTLKRMNNERQ